MSAVLSPMTIFRVEQTPNLESVKAVINDVLPVYAELWSKGRSKNMPFEPDMEVMVNLVSAGYRRFVTGRREGRIVCLQNWICVPDVECSQRKTAMMTGIFKREPDACDLTEFIRFGILTMKGLGYTSVVLSCYAAVPGLKEKMERAGAKLVEYLMEA